jgi:hypothetical protein
MVNDNATATNTHAPVLRLKIPGYRERYAAGDFANTQARTLDDRIARHLYATARYLPWGRPQKLVLEVAKDSRNRNREDETVEAYHSMFKWRAYSSMRKLGRQLPLVAILLVLGAFFLWAAHRVEGFEWEEETAKTVGEAIRLGAWVSGWTAISLLFSHGFESLRKYFVFHQLAKAPIEFEYSKTEKPTHWPSRNHRRTRA